MKVFIWHDNVGNKGTVTAENESEALDMLTHTFEVSTPRQYRFFLVSGKPQVHEIF